MRFLIGLVIAVIFVSAFSSQLRRIPQVFYVAALLFDTLLIASSYLVLPPWFNEYVLFLFQSNTLAMGFFTIVMFVGVLNANSSLRKQLLPVRAEISIIASILCVGHIVKYGESYLSQMAGLATNGMPSLRIAATLTALLLVALLIPLAITSVKRVRARLSPQVWTRLQKLSYLFYGLIFVHILLYLLPSALGGSVVSTVSVFVYLILGLLYALLRVRQFEVSRGRSAEKVLQ